MTDIVEEVYSELKKKDIRLSKRQFCEEYLGKSQCYLTTMKHYQKPVSYNALIYLRNNLKETADIWSSAYKENPVPRFREQSEFMSSLASKVESNIFSL